MNLAASNVQRHRATTAMADLVEQGSPLVRTLASRIGRELPVKVDWDELIGYGFLGLVEAAKDYDPDAGCQFTTFAYYRIRGAIYDGLAKMSWTKRGYWRKLRRARLAACLMEDSHADPIGSVEQEARRFGDLVAKLGVVYLTSQVVEGEEAAQDFVDDTTPPEARVEWREISDKLRQLVARLPVDQQSLVNSVYFEGLTLYEAGARLGISKSWASKLHARALESLGSDLRHAGAEID
jgi:RNA polymerase sigma factor for flagellar operon FliA